MSSGVRVKTCDQINGSVFIVLAHCDLPTTRQLLICGRQQSRPLAEDQPLVIFKKRLLESAQFSGPAAEVLDAESQKW